MQADVKGIQQEPAEAAWSRYWAAGHAHSCPTSFEGFYGPQLQQFWRRQAACLGPDDVVLDLGCGNGALLRFVASLFAGREGPMLHGVDAAEVRPDWIADAGPRVRIHPGTSFSALPLASGSVSFVASQFGVEYANTEETWAQVLRVLRPRARVALVLHKRGSRLDRVATDELGVARFALGAGGVFEAARTLLPYLEQGASDAGRTRLRNDAAAEGARLRFNAATAALVNLSGMVSHGDYAHDILRDLMDLLGQLRPGLGVGVQARLDILVRGVEDHMARIEALCANALDASAVEALRARLNAAGFTLADTAIMTEQGFEMGWILEGGREHAS